MGPLRPARPKRKKAAATTAPDKGATTTKALPLALLLLLLPTGAKCAHRNQTTCGHTSPQPPRFGVVKRLTASKTILETRQLNSPAHEPANTAMPLEFRKQSMHLTPAQLNGNFANHWHLTTSPHSTNAHTVEQLDANFHDEPFTYIKRHINEWKTHINSYTLPLRIIAPPLEPGGGWAGSVRRGLGGMGNSCIYA